MVLAKAVLFCTVDHDWLVPWSIAIGAYERLRIKSPEAGKIPGLVAYRGSLSAEPNERSFKVVDPIDGNHMTLLEGQGGKSRQVPRHTSAVRRLFEMMVRTRQTRCVDPRDKLYAVLSLVGSLLQDTIVPDYSKSVRDVYMELTSLFLQSEVSEVLALGRVKQSRDSLQLPSWVVNWSDTTDTSPPLQLPEEMIGAGCWPSVRKLCLKPNADSDVLLARGLTVCTFLDRCYKPGDDLHEILRMKAEITGTVVRLRTRRHAAPRRDDIVFLLLGCRSLLLVRRAKGSNELCIVDECHMDRYGTSDIDQANWVGRVDDFPGNDIMDGGALRGMDPSTAYDDVPCAGLTDFEIH